MNALLSGKYDLHKVAVMITQTGGGCRATNYIGFIRRALEKAGMEHIPVISINMSGIGDRTPDFNWIPNLLIRAALRCNLRRYFHALCLSYAPLRTGARLRQRGSSEVDKKVPEFPVHEKASELLHQFQQNVP